MRIAGVWLAQKTGAKLIYDAHEYEPGRYSFQGISKETLKMFAELEDRSFVDVSRIITVSRGIGDLYQQRFKGPAPVLIYNTPEVSNDKVEMLSLREKAGLDLKTPLLAGYPH